MSHIDRKRLFTAILVIFALANALAALSSSIWLLALSRVVPAAVLPVFWGTASETAGQIAGPERAGRAVANVYFEIAAAMVLGIPAGTLGGAIFGWRGTFWALSALSLLMAAMLAFAMPHFKAPERLRIGHQAQIFKDPNFLANIALSVVFTASFTAYTYLADLLEKVAHVEPRRVGWWLMGYSLVGMAGNWAGGQLAERNALRATLIMLLVLAAGTAAIAPSANNATGLVAALAVWGIANTALYPICQVRVIRAATHAQALAGTMNLSMANAGIGLGALIGGAVIGKLDIGTIGYVAAVLALSGAALAAAIEPYLPGHRPPQRERCPEFMMSGY